MRSGRGVLARTLRSSPSERSRFRAGVARCALLALFAATLGPGLPSARADERDREPAPPAVFFPDPDPVTAKEIEELEENSYEDLNKAPVARDLQVRRYGVWSVSKLAFDLRQQSVEARTWNAALTAFALRDRLGDAPELWPLLEPLVRIVEVSPEPYRPAFSMLALGAFRGPEHLPPDPPHPDPLVLRAPEHAAKSAIEAGLDAITHRLDDGHPSVEVAAALALGKSGASSARERLQAEVRLADQAKVEPRMAVLVSVGLLPRPGDDAILIRALSDPERRIRRAAALAVTLQALHEPRPAWVAAPARVLHALTADEIAPQLEDGWEAVFARGVLASLSGDRPEWQTLFELATTPSAKEGAQRAAAQALVFCEEPWFDQESAERIVRGAALEPVVIAAFLLHLGTLASEEAINACEQLLKSAARRPVGKPEWDVRYYAVLGLVQALVDGRVTDAARRQRVVEVLETGVARGLQKGPFRDALARVLEYEKKPVLQSETYTVPERRVLELERTFDDAPGLLAHDLKDLAVRRLNDIVPEVFNVNSMRPGTPGNRDKSEMPRRFLKGLIDHYPYFSRLDLLADRGYRPRPAMPHGDDPRLEVDRR